jgi:hypothetical protein
MKSVFKSIAQRTFGNFLAKTVCSLALLTTANVDAKPSHRPHAFGPKKPNISEQQKSNANDTQKPNVLEQPKTAFVPPSVALGSPDIIEISVQHLSAVQEQLTQGLGITWRDTETTYPWVILEDGSRQRISLTRVFSDDSYPYIELVQAFPQVGPWAPFNDDEFGERPKSTLTWRIDRNIFHEVHGQFDACGATLIADGSDFLYYQCVEGVQIQIIKDFLVPDPADGIPNTPIPGIIDFGPMFHFSVALQAATNTNITEIANNIPIDDFNLRQQISAATGGGITWDINTPIVTTLPYRIDGGFSFLGNPSETYSCNPNPFLNVYEVYPVVAPFGATANSTTFSQAWVPTCSGFDPVGAQIMVDWENQLLAAGFNYVAQLVVNDLEPIFPYTVPGLSYFYGIDNVEILLVNFDFGNTQCTGSCPGCVNPVCPPRE